MLADILSDLSSGDKNCLVEPSEPKPTDSAKHKQVIVTKSSDLAISAEINRPKPFSSLDLQCRLSDSENKVIL